MWLLDNKTPFAADRGWVRDRDGTEIWLVAVKATFDIHPDGTTDISKQQPPILRIPEYYGEAGKSSIKYDVDLVLTKVATDIIAVGHAYAPNDEPVTELDVGFKVGPVQKVVRVFGDRGWGPQGPGPSRPFVRMPVTYERAFGGVDPLSEHPDRDWDWRNPVGRGFAVSRASAYRMLLPNIEDPGHLMRGWNDRPAPAGFGAIACSWQPRVSFSGTYDRTWERTRKPLVPDDFNNRYYQCAPQDQQSPGFLRGGEQVILHRLTPSGTMRFVLPRIFPGFETHFYGAGSEVHRTRNLHSVILEPDYPRVSLVWHSALPCHFKVQKLNATTITVKQDVSADRRAVMTAI